MKFENANDHEEYWTEQYPRVMSTWTQDVTLFGNKVFADVIVPRWGPTGLRWAWHSRKSGEGHPGRRQQTLSVTLPQAKEHQGLQTPLLGNSDGQFLPRAPTRSQPCSHLDFGYYTSWTMMGWMFAVFQQTSFLPKSPWQPWEANTENFGKVYILCDALWLTLVHKDLLMRICSVRRLPCHLCPHFLVPAPPLHTPPHPLKGSLKYLALAVKVIFLLIVGGEKTLPRKYKKC